MFDDLDGLYTPSFYNHYLAGRRKNADSEKFSLPEQGPRA